MSVILRTKYHQARSACSSYYAPRTNHYALIITRRVVRRVALMKVAVSAVAAVSIEAAAAAATVVSTIAVRVDVRTVVVQLQRLKLSLAVQKKVGLRQWRTT